jgi:hypothetical protein
MKTVNREGHDAYRMDWKTKLVTMVLTSFFNEKKFYGDNSDELVNCIKSGIIDDPQFVSNLAIFARREFNMRTVSHVITGYLANIPQGKPFVKRTVKSIVMRGDDATELLAFYLDTFGKPIPNSLRKALRDIFQTFDAYTLAKYKGEGHSVKMRDILCLCRPAPKNEEQSKFWKDLLEGKIKPAYTWETELSAKGNNKETWEELISSGRVGYMALLRNLRNIMNAKPDNISQVFDKLSDPEAVRKNRQLPFRYLSAYREIPYDSWWKIDACEALEKAADISVENLPKIPGRTVIAIDTSGSMSCSLSRNSGVQCKDIAMLLGLIANRICENAIVYSFDDALKELIVSKCGGLISTAMRESCCGGGTDMYLPMEHILKNRIEADRIIYISDNECNYQISGNPTWYGHSETVQTLADAYRRTVNPDFWVHAIDLQGYGTQQFIGNKTDIIAGWSEKIFEFITLTENGLDSLIKRIQTYSLVQ